MRPEKTKETVVTYLEMTTPRFTHVPAPANLKIMLLRLEEPTVGYYRYLYDAVGRPLTWVDRKSVNDEELAKIRDQGSRNMGALCRRRPRRIFRSECESIARRSTWPISVSSPASTDAVWASGCSPRPSRPAGRISHAHYRQHLHARWAARAAALSEDGLRPRQTGQEESCTSSR